MFCLDYYPNRPYLKEVGELKIKYKKGMTVLKDFLEEHKNQSIVIDVTGSFDDLDAKLFKALLEEDGYQNFKLIISFYNKEHLELIQKYKLPFFFINSVVSIDQLHGFLKYNPTDMYICEILGFSLDKIYKLLNAAGVRVRVYPNICQSSFPTTPSLKTFFIRPEDIKMYSYFVDVFELISDAERQSVIYKIYKQGKWIGPINQIIPSFKDDLDSRYLLNTFGLFRIKCGKKCMYDSNSCKICDKYVTISKVFEDKNIMIKKEKEKEFDN